MHLNQQTMLGIPSLVESADPPDELGRLRLVWNWTPAPTSLLWIDHFEWILGFLSDLAQSFHHICDSIPWQHDHICHKADMLDCFLFCNLL